MTKRVLIVEDTEDNRRIMRIVLTGAGFEVLEVFGVRNRYPLEYWLHLAPLPRPLKAALGRPRNRSALGY